MKKHNITIVKPKLKIKARREAGLRTVRIYCGRRVKRGLFKSADGTLINADVNGSYNILRKCMPNAFDADGVAGVLVHPVVIKATNAFH